MCHPGKGQEKLGDYLHSYGCAQYLHLGNSESCAARRGTKADIWNLTLLQTLAEAHTPSMYIRIHVRICTYTYVHTYIYICTYIHTHTFVAAPRLLSFMKIVFVVGI